VLAVTEDDHGEPIVIVSRGALTKTLTPAFATTGWSGLERPDDDQRAAGRVSSAVERLLSRLEGARSNGRDRWRCACPVCGGKNRSTLSIGIGDNGCALVKCWKDGCAPDAIAAAVGLDLRDLFPPRDASAPPLNRRRLSRPARRSTF
jgi:hypothetical protein